MAAPGAILRVREEGVAVLGVRAVHACCMGFCIELRQAGSAEIGVPVDYGRRPSQARSANAAALQAHRARAGCKNV